MALIVVNESSLELDEKLEQALPEVVRAALAPQWNPEDVEIGLTLVDDEAIAELNEQYRGVAGPTDVLSFPLFTDRKSTRLNSSHVKISYAVFCLKKKKIRMKKY